MSKKEAIIELIKNNHLLTKYNLERIGLFGSFIREQEFNDIDIFIEGNIEYKSLIDFKSELESLTNKKVDLVLEKFANPIILYRAKKEMIYVKEH